jgi:hypothetical protein
MLSNIVSWKVVLEVEGTRPRLRAAESWCHMT